MLNVRKAKTSSIFIILIAGITLILASLFQLENKFFFLKISAFILAFFIIFTHKEFNVLNSLALLIILYLRPVTLIFFIGMAFVLICFLIEFYYSGKTKVKIPFYKSSMLLIFITLISLSKAYSFKEGLELYLFLILSPILLIIIIYNSRINIFEIKKILKLLIYIAVIVSAVGVYLAIRNPDLRIGSLWVTAMTINAFYLISFFIAIGFSLEEKAIKNKVIYIIFSAIILLGMVFSYTRMALLSVSLGLFLIVLRIKEIRKYIPFLIFFIFFIIPVSLHERLSRGLLEDTSMIVRYIAWFNSFQIIKKNLLFGIGFNTFAHIYQNYIPLKWLYAEHSHNIYLRFMMEFGIIGFSAYFYILIKILVKFYHIIKHHDSFNLFFCLFIGIVSILFSCLTDVFISRYSISILFWIILGFMLKIVYELEKSNSKQ